MNRAADIGGDGAQLVHRSANDVHDAAKHSLTDGHSNGVSGVLGALTTGQTVGGLHGDATNGVFTKVLGHDTEQDVLDHRTTAEDKAAQIVAWRLHVPDHVGKATA